MAFYLEQANGFSFKMAKGFYKGSKGPLK